jgi:hypothetical protein
MSASAVTADAWLERDERDWRDGRRFEVRSSRFQELRTQNFELRITRHASLAPRACRAPHGSD